MPGPLANLVLERANAPGTAATFNLGGAPSGWIGFVGGIGNGGTAYYYMSDGVQAEWGYGTVTAGALNSLGRTVIGNTQGTATRLNFTGAVDVWCNVPAERTPFFDAVNATLPMGGRRLAGLGTGSAGDDAPRLDQVAWRHVNQTVFSATTQAAVVMSLPTALERFRLEYSDVGAPGGAQLYVRMSVDGGATFAQGSADYSWCSADVRPNGVTAAGGTWSYLPVSASLGSDAIGTVEFQASGAKRVLFDAHMAAPGPVMSRVTGGGNCNAAGRATHVLLGAVGQPLGAARVRLAGAAA